MSRHGMTTQALLLTLLCSLALACGGDAPRDDAQRRSSAGFGDGYGGDAATDASADAPSLAIPDDAPLVVVLGDSLSAGLHLPVSQAWPAQVQRLLADDGLLVRLQNAGVSGDTSAGGLSRLAWVLTGRPDVVVIELGGNDGLRGQPLDAIERNLRALVEGVRSEGAQPVLVAMHIPSNYGPAYASGFEAIYPRVADELDVPLVADFLDGVGGVPSMNLPDGIHPTPEGHRRLAENARDDLREVLRTIVDAREDAAAR